MNGSVEKKEKKKSKFRFNFIDLLVLALTIIVFLSLLVSAFYQNEQQQELLVTLQLEAADAEQLKRAGVGLLEGSTVYKTDGKTPYGTLAKDYEGGEDTLLLRVIAQKEGSDRFMGGVRLYVGRTVNVQCGTLRAYSLTVEDITEVSEHD